MIESADLIALILQIYIGFGIAKAILAITGAYVVAWTINKFNQLPIWLLAVGYPQICMMCQPVTRGRKQGWQCWMR